MIKVRLGLVQPSGQTLPFKYSDHHKRTSVSIYSERSEDAAGSCVYSAMYHYRRAGGPADGWAALTSPFITLVNLEGIFFSFPW